MPVLFTAVSSAPRTMSTISRCSINICCLNKWPPDRALLPLLPPVVCLHRSQRDPCKMWTWSFDFSSLNLPLYSPTFNIKSEIFTMTSKGLPDLTPRCLSYIISYPSPFHLQLASNTDLPVIPRTQKTFIYTGMFFPHNSLPHFIQCSAQMLPPPRGLFLNLSNSTCPSLYPLILVLYFFYSSYH